MLENGDFTGGETRRAIAWTPDGFATVERGEVSVPAGWMAWWREWFPGVGQAWGDTVQPTGAPEIKVLRSGFQDKVRLGGADAAVQVFTFWRNQDAGLLQQVEVGAGKLVEFSAFGHGWYSDCDSRPHDPPYERDCKSLALDSHLWLSVGIDPHGRLDPTAVGVVWSDECEQYGGYAAPLVVKAVSQVPMVTVYLRARSNYALKHVDAYWRTCSLETSDAVAMPAWGLPRVQYIRTYVLMPPDATEEEWKAAIDRHPGNTIGGSADDAGIGALDVRNVIAVDPHRWPDGKDKLREFFPTYYPGTTYTEEFTQAPPADGMLLWQCDPEWRDYVYGIKSLGRTLCRWGCYVTDLAMARRVFGMNPNETPVSVDKALGETGYSGASLPMWSAIEAKLRIKVRDGTTTQARAHLDAGHLAMARVELSGEHWVLVHGYQGDRFWISDPAKNKSDWLDALYPAGPQAWRLLTPVEDTPPTPQPGP